MSAVFGAVIGEHGRRIRITVIATGFEQSRVATRRPVKRAARQRCTHAPATRGRRAPEPPPAMVEPEDEAVPAPPKQQAPAKNVGEGFTSQVYDTDNLDIPAFLRRR